MKLSDFAKQNNLSYATAWRRFKEGKIEGAIQGENGLITVPDQTKPIKEAVASINTLPIQADINEGKIQVAIANTRRNRATTIQPTDRYANIDSGMLPYKQVAGGIGNDSLLSARDAILLCKKAYFNFSEVRSLLEYFTSVATGKIYFKGGNKKSRDFFQAWLKKIGIFHTQQQWYRERNRSGNIYFYRQEGLYGPAEIASLMSVYGLSTAAEKLKLPIRYLMLDPADIALQPSAAFATPAYHKLYNDYELACLRNPRTPEDRELFESLDPKIQAQIKSNKSQLYIPLPTDLIHYYGYKKSDYEAFGISLLFSVLDDLEFYAELRKGDQAINRTLQQAVLLITMGYQDKEGNAVVSQTAVNAMAKLFENESTARVVVSTFDTKMEFLIPQIADLLDPVKYQVVRERIKEGLNNILTGSGEKFSNRSVSVQLFIQQVRDARQEFLEEFLQPEVKRISQELGFKTYPEAAYEDINLKDEVEWNRIITRFIELGALTPEEGFESIQTGKLPTKEDSLQNQEELRKQKDKGLYQPMQGGPYDQLKIAKVKGAMAPPGNLPKINGRPKGSPNPKVTKKVSPVKASEQKYDFEKIKQNLLLATQLEGEIKQSLRNKHNISELTPEQQGFAEDLAENIIYNEKPENWLDCVEVYVNEPKEKIINEAIEEIASYHEHSQYLSAILLNSQYESE